MGFRGPPNVFDFGLPPLLWRGRGESGALGAGLVCSLLLQGEGGLGGIAFFGEVLEAGASEGCGWFRIVVFLVWDLGLEGLI